MSTGAIAPAQLIQSSAHFAIGSSNKKKEGRRNRQFAQREAQKTRDFQLHMANTAYQRMRKDLLRAGFNPLLALGASPVGVGGAASASAPGPQQFGDRADTSWGNTALQRAMQMEQFKTMAAQRELLEAQTNREMKEGGRAHAMMDHYGWQNELLRRQIPHAELEKEFYESDFGRAAVYGGHMGDAARRVTSVVGNFNPLSRLFDPRIGSRYNRRVGGRRR